MQLWIPVGMVIHEMSVNDSAINFNRKCIKNFKNQIHNSEI